MIKSIRVSTTLEKRTLQQYIELHFDPFGVFGEGYLCDKKRPIPLLDKELFKKVYSKIK